MYRIVKEEGVDARGGGLMYRIPQFRLPKEIVQTEVEYVRKLGVKIHLDSMVGKLKTIQDLFDEGFDAVFIGACDTVVIAIGQSSNPIIQRTTPW